MENVSLQPIVVIHMIMSEIRLVAPLMQTTNLIHIFFSIQIVKYGLIIIWRYRIKQGFQFSLLHNQSDFPLIKTICFLQGNIDPI